VQLEAAQILRVAASGDGREGCERPHVANLVAGVFSVKPRTVMSSIMRARSALTGRWKDGGHRGSSLELKVAGPSMLGIGCPGRHALPLTASPLPKKCTDRDARHPARAGSF